ncbi:RidA family protein [Bradyrhizobium septentrionale]|uniref:RidA family protein n=1 Tax=Bradyrhizobium septentrionale TaxID=1404411 RepID=A0ABZ2P0E3_9BRAD
MIGALPPGGTIADDTSVSMGEQTRNILGKISGYLKQAGTDPSRIVSVSIFVTDLSKKTEMDAVWTEFFGDNLPARATVGVADLGGGALIEVVVTALKG